jgi:uncharacterized protein (DUF2147 family)
MMAALLLMATPASVATAGDIRGDWVNQRGTAIIRIDNCASGLCGTVVWSAPTAQRDAIRGGTADLNGSIVMSGFVRATERRWRGTLFLPDQNRMVKATIELRGNDQLQVKGCELAGLVCRSQRWNRRSAG